MVRRTALLAWVLFLGSACAEGSSGPPGTGRDGAVTILRDGAAGDAPIGLRPDGGFVRRDAGSGCPEVCMLPNAASSCVADRCVVDACDAGWGDCDGDEATGCETPLDSADHCGACGNACAIPNATSTCTSGMCALGMCNPGFGDCNGSATDGCETPLDSATHCGACGNACPSGSSCTGGSCGVVSCPGATSNCDSDDSNGCEIDHAAYSNTCMAPENLGAAGGDLACGFLCPATTFRALATRQGRLGRWFSARAQECSSCAADVYHCFRLEVPAGVDYDLIVHNSCGSLLGSMPAGPGATEEFCVFQTDDFSGGDNSFDYLLEVRHRSGASCIDWRLTVEHAGCSCG